MVTEAHNRNELTNSPDILISAIAARTKKIRVGACGINIRYHYPLRIIEKFKTLEALYPDRIDLGISSGYHYPPQLAAAYDTAFRTRPEDIPALYGELFDPPFDPMPGISLPPVWVPMTPKLTNAVAIGKRGVGYVVGNYESLDAVSRAIDAYREAFEKAGHRHEPRIMVDVVYAPQRFRKDMKFRFPIMEEGAITDLPAQIGVLRGMTDEILVQAPVYNLEDRFICYQEIAQALT